MRILINNKLIPRLFLEAKKKSIPFEELLQSVSEKDLVKKTPALNIEDKIELAKWFILQGLKEYQPEEITIAWTGGKDSTLILWLALEVVKKNHLKMPSTMFINEGHTFEEIEEFVKEYTHKWNLDNHEVKNDNVLKQAAQVGDRVEVAKLDERNQQEVKRVGFEKSWFPFEPESVVGNHLMKTVAMNRYLEKTKYKAVITGIRWDEQEAREDELFFSPRGDDHTPKHMRIHPILHFTERDVWDATLKLKVPYCSLYKQGFRSLGAKGTTAKAADKPAWEQDFKEVTERAGRRQDKEGVMDRLRKLGYM